MDHIGIDVHKKESQICILAEGGELLEQRIRTEPARFATMLSARPRGRIGHVRVPASRVRELQAGPPRALIRKASLSLEQFEELLRP